MATDEEKSSVISRCAQRLAALCETEKDLPRIVHLTGEDALTAVRKRLEMERASIDFQDALGVLKRGGRVRRRDWPDDRYLKGHGGVVCIFFCAPNMLAEPRPWEADEPFSLGNRLWVEV